MDMAGQLVQQIQLSALQKHKIGPTKGYALAQPHTSLAKDQHALLALDHYICLVRCLCNCPCAPSPRLHQGKHHLPLTHNPLPIANPYGQVIRPLPTPNPLPTPFHHTHRPPLLFSSCCHPSFQSTQRGPLPHVPVICGNCFSGRRHRRKPSVPS